MFAALASTIDTHINWGSSYLTNDIFKRFVFQAMLKKQPDEKTLVWVARGGNVLMVLIALAVMTQLVSINQAWQTSLLLGAGMGVVIVLRWLWWRTNAWAEIAAMLSSLVAAPVLLTHIDTNALRLLLIALISSASALVAIYWAGPEQRDKLRNFYQKTRPPGYWRPIADELGETRYDGTSRLKRSLGATLLSSISIFCILVGIGSWMVGSPPPVFCPSALLWNMNLIAVGLLLCPAWITSVLE
ncbi:MAG: hypothetical protein JXA30_19180 [Deltaproteobacteria bacterium]|nr:hypothetical protein [Deltaproteobacteria bacterium]